jgi:hypothetical protein
MAYHSQRRNAKEYTQIWAQLSAADSSLKKSGSLVMKRLP